jgi:hypothetical protein
MRCLSLQIKPEAIPDFDRKEFLSLIRSGGRSPEIDAFEENGVSYLNFNFFTEKPDLLWQELKNSVYGGDYGAYLKKISLVACEAEKHEEDLVLHHFDSQIKLDSL